MHSKQATGLQLVGQLIGKVRNSLKMTFPQLPTLIWLRIQIWELRIRQEGNQSFEHQDPQPRDVLTVAVMMIEKIVHDMDSI